MENNMKKTVLVTAIGTVTATAIVKELKKAGNYYIIGADINNQYEIATSLDVDEYYKFPYSTGEDYVPFALDFCRKHNVEYYFAVIDKEVVNISRNRALFAEIGTRLCVADHDLAEICHFKNSFGKWLDANFPEIAIREYRSAQEAEKASFPVFIKPSEGVGSSGCRQINSFQELLTAVDACKLGTDFVVQDFVSGMNITVDCVRNRRTGQKIQVQRRELLRNSNGCGIAVEIFHSDELEKICDRLMEKLDLNGVINIEFFETENGYKLIEINPRFSAGTLFSCMAGANTVMNAVHIADEQPCEFGQILIGAHFAERYEPYRMN